MHDFLDDLENQLMRLEMTKEERKEIIDDYRAIIEEAKERGLDDEQIMAKIGSPQAVFKALKGEYEVKTTIKRSEKYIALSPFLATILFFALGFGANLWHPGWLAFLLVPVTAIVVEMFGKKEPYAFTALTPFISLIVFFVLGHFGYWHPGWLVFLLIPISGIIESYHEEAKKHEHIGGLLLFGSLIAFVMSGYITGLYLLTWLVLLLPVAYFIIFEPKLAKQTKVKHGLCRWLTFISLLVSVGLYVWLGIYVTTWGYATAAFLIFIITGILTGYVTFHSSGTYSLLFKMVTIVALLAFIGVGWYFDAWAVSWLFFLSIPLLAVLLVEKKHKLTAASPFVSVTVFFLLGWFFNLWHVAWLVFLMIPVFGILEEGK